MLRIRLFGQPRFEYGNLPYAFRARPRVLPLLAYLLLHRYEPVTRATLAYALWTDETEENARANLRRHLNHLRCALPREKVEWVVSDGTTVQWNPEAAYRLDVAEFETKSREGFQPEDAVELYTGDLFQSLYDDWIFYERERLRNIFFHDLDRLIESSTTRGDFTMAAQYVQRLLEHDPLREDAVRRLMQLRAQEGDRAGAIQLYEHFRRRLRRELEVEPMDETLALYRAILDKSFSAPRKHPAAKKTPAPTRERGTDAVKSDIPFVGRGIELEQLHTSFTRAARGSGTLVLIGGEAGIGKTRLVSAIAALAEQEGAMVLWGGTSFPEASPYQAFTEALRMAQQTALSGRGERARRRAFASLFRELEFDGEPTPSEETIPLTARTKLFELFARCFVAFATARPLVVCLEDLHWASGATSALLEFLARHLEREPILMLATYREEETPRAHPLRILRRNMQREQRLTHLALSRLDAAAVSEWVARIFPSNPDLARAIFRASEGNALFVHELVRAYGEDEPTPADLELMPNITATISARLARLSPATRDLAEIAATLGVAFTTELLREVSGASEAALRAAFGELLDRQLIRETGASSGLDYTFTHHLIQMVVYDGASSAQRARRHARVGRVMEELYGARTFEQSAEIARHFDLGDEPGQACGWYQRAAEYAARLFANDEAVEFYERAVACAHQAADMDQAATALMGLASVQAKTGRDVPATETLSRALTLAPARPIKNMVELQLGELWADLQDKRARPLLDQVLQELDPRAQSQEILRAQTTLAIIDVHQGKIRHTVESLEDVNERLKPYPDPATAENILMILGLAYRNLAEFDRALHYGHATLDYGAGAGSDWLVLLGNQMIARALLGLGNWKQAEQYAGRAYELAVHVGTPELAYLNQAGRAEAQHAQGQLASAFDIVRSAWNMGTSVLGGLVATNVAALYTIVATDAGQDEEAQQVGESAVHLGRSSGHYDRHAMTHFGRAYFYVQQGEWSAAVKEFHALEQLIRDTDNRLVLLKTNAYYAQALLGLGQFDEAQKLADAHVDQARATHAKHAEGVGQRVRGEILVAQGEWKAARQAFAEAVRILDALGSRLELARAYHARAVCEYAAGDRAAARRNAKRARSLFEEMGAPRDLARVADLD